MGTAEKIVGPEASPVDIMTTSHRGRGQCERGSSTAHLSFRGRRRMVLLEARIRPLPAHPASCGVASGANCTTSPPCCSSFAVGTRKE